MSERQVEDLNGVAIKFAQNSVSDALMLYVRTRMAEPHRHYHTLAHCLDLQNKYVQLRVTDHAHYPQDIQWAIWLHDLFYFPQNKDSEERSARFAEAVIDDSNCAVRVGEMIRMTNGHAGLIHNKETLDQKIFMDLDLSILAADEDRFDLYCEQIRSEYTFVSEGLYRTKRKAILQEFIDRRIFRSGLPGTEFWESQAKDNLKRAIEKLK